MQNLQGAFNEPFIRLLPTLHLLVIGGLFLYNFAIRKERNRMEGYDNDALLLMLDDDLFPYGEDTPESEK